MYRLFFKRAIDIFLSLIFILLFWWLYFIVAILVRVKLGSPILFKQDRPGFRTMTDKKDKDGNLLPDSERLTKFGKFLRSTSLDEIPEFFNILKGDMSLIGPRPLLVKYLNRYSKEQLRRHNVRPGISGWAQVNGRNAISWEDKFKYDIEYVDNLSFLLDLKIIILTIKKVLIRDGISQVGNATMEEFKGEQKNE